MITDQEPDPLPLPADRLRAVILDAVGPCIGPDATYELRRLLEGRRVDR